MRGHALVLTISAVLFVSACSDDPEKLCVAGKSEACVGEGGCAGGQVCNESGSAFGPCVCASTPQDSGTPPSDGGSDAGVADGGEDAGTDGGTGTCDLLAAPGQQGCASGQKCTWIVVAELPTVGKVGCVPDGTVPLNAACTQGAVGETTGYDDCVAGAICINSKCADICGFDPNADAGCAADNQCIRYAGLFSNGDEEPIAGACAASCNPVTQQAADGGSACAQGQGCYLLTSSTSTIAVCAGAGTVQHNQELTGTVFANSCVPGHQPRRRDSSSQSVECGALCAPANVTSTTNVSSEGGVAPFDCQTQSASSPTPAAAPDDAMAGESCRYYWAREPFTELSPFSNTVGWCFKHVAFFYDSNGDMTADAPFPRCSTLTTGDVVPPVEDPPGNDALYFWCVESPSVRSLIGGNARPAVFVEPRLDRIGGWRR